MSTLDILRQAIDKRKSIEYEYNKEGKISKRIGNPYAIYIYDAKTTGERNMKVDIVQTEGESDTKDTKPFPSFRGFLNIEDILNVERREDIPPLTPPFHEDYNPESDRYNNLIAKI